MVEDEVVPAGGDKEHCCPKNFQGSSKSMESVGAAALVTRAWESGNWWVKSVVGNDNSSSRTALTMDLAKHRELHPDKDRAACWPKKWNEKKQREEWVPNKGKLHPDVRGPSCFYCNPTHHWRVIGKHTFKLANKPAQTLVTKADAMRAKRNYGYAHKQSRDKSFEEYKKAMNGTILHHANDHSCCHEDWCPYKAGRKRPEDNKHSVLC